MLEEHFLNWPSLPDWTLPLWEPLWRPPLQHLHHHHHHHHQPWSENERARILVCLKRSWKTNHFCEVLVDSYFAEVKLGRVNHGSSLLTSPKLKYTLMTFDVLDKTKELCRRLKYTFKCTCCLDELDVYPVYIYIDFAAFAILKISHLLFWNIKHWILRKGPL